MSTPILKLVYDRRKRATAKKEGSVELRITLGREQRFVSTGVRLLPKEWKSGSVTGRLDAYEVQHTLDMFVASARQTINQLSENGEFDMDTIVGIIGCKQRESASRNVPSTRSVMDYFKERATFRKYGMAKDTQERYDRFLKWFGEWGGMQTFDDVTGQNIIKMDEALRKKGMTDYSKWHNYHRFLNSFCIDAVEDGLISKNPYHGLRIKKVTNKETLTKYLTKEEFTKIATMALPMEYLRHARDLFVFQTLTCLAYVDLASFDMGKIRYIDGKPIYRSKRGKTSQEYTFLVLPTAMEILERYGGNLPIMTNQKYNEYLKTISVMAGIGKPLSSHWARHTGATLMLNGGVEMEIVAKVLGHSSTRITREVYAKLLDTTVADAMENFAKSL